MKPSFNRNFHPMHAASALVSRISGVSINVVLFIFRTVLVRCISAFLLIYHLVLQPFLLSANEIYIGIYFDINKNNLVCAGAADRLV